MTSAPPPAATRRYHVLVARASFHGKFVEEQFVRTGRPIEIGTQGPLTLPLPEGLPYAVRVVWRGGARVVVKDGWDRVHDLEPGQDLELQFGAVTLQLLLVERLAHRRSEFSPTGGLAWFSVVVMMAALTSQAAWFVGRQCELAWMVLPRLPDVGGPILWVVAPILGMVAAIGGLLLAEQPQRALRGLALPVLALVVPLAYTVGGFTWKDGTRFIAEELPQCMPPQGAEGAGGGAFSAEYLARLLRKDLDGEEQGVVEQEIDRPDAERVLKDDDIFMPAGAKGPVTKMGGAADTASKPVRTLVEEPVAPAEQVPTQDALTAESGPEVERPKPAEEEPRDGEKDGLVAEEEEGSGEAAPAEEKEGWGIPEWYDERDEQLDQLEINLMLRAAQRRLAIDPDNAAALSVLSYYQYLAQDYGAAKGTYDRYIELYPDDPAGYNNKALVYKRLGEYQKEESLYRVALSLEPSDVTAMNNLAVNLAHQGRTEEAWGVMVQLEQLDPKDAYADLHRAKVKAQMGQDEEALTYLDAALRGMAELDTLHHIEFRQDIRLDPSFAKLRETYRFRAILNQYYGKDSPLEE